MPYPPMALITILRTFNALYFKDTCVIKVITYSVDSYREITDSATDSAATACQLIYQPGTEMKDGDNITLAYDASIRLPIGTTISAKDRVSITHRYGTALGTTILFEVLSPPRTTTLCVQANLKKVTL